MEIVNDPIQIAKKAELRYISDKKVKGFSRVKKGDGFGFLDTKGAPITDNVMVDRLTKIYIPPAWKNVWISPFANGHIQAVGYDEKGRKQYVYHEGWITMMQQNKFEKVIYFGEHLPDIRRQIKKDMELPGLPKERVLGTLVWLLQNTFIRVGNQEYAKENQSYGLTTLRTKHVDLHRDSATLSFKGKSGVMHEVDIDNPKVLKTIRKCVELPGYELFQYISENGEKKHIDSSDVNEYLHEITKEDITAKDFRTWGGSMLAAVTLLDLGMFDTQKTMAKNVRTAVKKVSEHLRNTTSVCKKYYIHPTVINSYEQEKLLRHFQECTDKRPLLSSNECALISLLEQPI